MDAAHSGREPGKENPLRSASTPSGARPETDDPRLTLARSLIEGLDDKYKKDAQIVGSLLAIVFGKDSQVQNLAGIALAHRSRELDARSPR